MDNQIITNRFEVRISPDLLKNLEPEVLDKKLNDLYNLSLRFGILNKYKTEDPFLDSLGDYKSYYLGDLDRLLDHIYNAWDSIRMFLIEHGAQEEDLPYLGS